MLNKYLAAVCILLNMHTTTFIVHVCTHSLFLLVQPTESQDEDSQDEPPASVSTSGVTADIYSGVSIRVRNKLLVCSQCTHCHYSYGVSLKLYGMIKPLRSVRDM